MISPQISQDPRVETRMSYQSQSGFDLYRTPRKMHEGPIGIRDPTTHGTVGVGKKGSDRLLSLCPQLELVSRADSSNGRWL